MPQSVDLASLLCSRLCHDLLSPVGADPRALLEQLHAPLAHFRIALVAQQLDAVVQRPDGAEQVVAQAGAEKGGEFDRCGHGSPPSD